MIRDLLIEEIEENKVLEEEALKCGFTKRNKVDVTLPGRKVKAWYTSYRDNKIMEEIEDIFVGYGVTTRGRLRSRVPDHYNFRSDEPRPKDHPARDMQDTFYISDEILIRTHTSPVQASDNGKACDLSRGISTNDLARKSFRRDTDDATHSHQFHQIEGLVVDKNITMG